MFESSLRCELAATDDDARYLCDTYLIWAGLENNFGNRKEYDRLITEAKTQCAKIHHKQKNAEMSRVIERAEQVASKI